MLEVNEGNQASVKFLTLATLFFSLPVKTVSIVMASMKAEKPVGTQLFGQAKKEPAKAGEGPAKATASKPAVKKAAAAAAQKPQETKKKGKGGKGGKAAAK